MNTTRKLLRGKNGQRLRESIAEMEACDSQCSTKPVRAYSAPPHRIKAYNIANPPDDESRDTLEDIEQFYQRLLGKHARLSAKRETP